MVLSGLGYRCAHLFVCACGSCVCVYGVGKHIRGSEDY